MAKKDKKPEIHRPLRPWAYAAGIICVWSLFLFFSWAWVARAISGTLATADIIPLDLMFGLLWTMGIGGTFLSLYFLNRQIQRRQLAESQLLQHKKMEGVVEMAGAVCHELNQPLQMILGNAEIMLLDLEPDHPFSKRIRNIQEQVKRMSKMTRNLIRITRYETKQFPQGTVIDIDKASKEAPTSSFQQIEPD